MTLIMNIVVVSVFWTLLADVAFKKYQGDTLKIVNAYWTHTVPALTVLINFALSDVTMRAKHSIVVPPPAIIYGFVNYLETQKRQTPIYWFLTWKNYQSYFIYAGLILLFMLVFMGLSQLTVVIKRPTSDKYQSGKS